MSSSNAILTSSKDISAKNRFTNLLNKHISNYYTVNNKSHTPDENMRNQFVPNTSHSSINLNFANIQTKLKVSEPGDIYEQEADRVAEQIMNSNQKINLLIHLPTTIKK